MKEIKPPFKFDFRDLLKDARKKLNTRIDGVTINLPFLSFSVNPEDIEKRIAREIIIRVADKRVLNAFECCDNCIAQALDSLQEIRRFLVDKQVELSNAVDNPLYLLVELQVEAIRQFLTFEQRFKEKSSHKSGLVGLPKNLGQPPTIRDQYFAALEMLRAHLHRCLIQMAKIADIQIPKISTHMRYDEAWQLEAYEHLSFLPNGNP